METNDIARGISEHWTDGVDHPAVEVLVGIPAFNEEVGIGSVVLMANQYADGVIVVDDGSTDRTAETAELAGATVIRHETNRGKGAAIRTILDSAATIGCEALVLIDGDGQHVPAEIAAVAAPALDGDADLVVGNRHHGPGSHIETPRYRRVGQYGLDRLTRFVTGVDVTDTQSGFRALSPQAIESIAPETDAMGIESEMLHAATREDLRVTEVPIDVRYDGIDGQTFNPIYHGVVVGIRILSLPRARYLVAASAVLSLVTVRLIHHRGGKRRGRALGNHPPTAPILFLLGLVCGSVLALARNVLQSSSEQRP